MESYTIAYRDTEDGLAWNPNLLIHCSSTDEIVSAMRQFGGVEWVLLCGDDDESAKPRVVLSSRNPSEFLPVALRIMGASNA